MPFLPFRVAFSDRAIEDLHRRLEDTRWPDVGWDTGWGTGTNDSVLRDLVRYWRNDFDWPAQEAALNARAHVRGVIDGDEMHAMLMTGPGSERRVPLLLIHGWPGSFIEFTDAGERLSKGVDGAPGFDVVVPSLPGFGFSDTPRAAGLHPGRIAERLHLLMRELGYERYGVQGGDWGGIIGTALARQHPEAAIGLHLNFSAGGPPPPEGTQPSEAEQVYRAFRQQFEVEETGYSRIQGTRPQTLGYALSDSPVGLLAWILEKFWAWAAHGDDLWERLDRDRVLTNVTLYWLTGHILSASRIYYEMSHATERVLGRIPDSVPVGFAKFPAEPWAAPRDVMERIGNLVHYSEVARGGHFAAFEEPELFAADVSRFFAGL
ncbi:MAG: epoxide hydrolase [Chloroflexi bacterium]|nr:MAG: epoxide hydrolase [Chloroflexota bacterium]